MRIAESELIINGDGSVFHLHLRPEELADNIILVGDPGRVDMVAEYFEDKEFRHASREFVSVTGKYKGVRMTALSTGIGTDNIDIVMNELDALANIALYDGVSLYTVILGAILVVIAGLIVLGGLQRIASFAEKVVPFMVVQSIIIVLSFKFFIN